MLLEYCYHCVTRVGLGWFVDITLLWCIVFSLYGAAIATHDFQYRRVPNKLLLVAIGLQTGLLILLWQTNEVLLFGAQRWDQSLIGLALGLILFYPLWRFRALGAGDVKFIAVLGFLLGPAGLFPVLLLGTVACGLHALGMVLLMGWTSARNVWRASPATRRGVPYAAYLALAAIAWMIWKVSEEGLRIAWGG